jgi:membrane-associated phospholipid phosphatase
VWIDDTLKVVLVLMITGMSLLGLWATVDRHSCFARRLRDVWRGPGPRIVVALLAAAVFVVVAEDILFDADAPTEIVSRVDRHIYPLVAESARRWHTAASVISWMTGEGLTLGVLLIIIALVVRRRQRDAWTLALGTVTAWAASGLLKGLTAVPRPRATHALNLFSSFGFPSGHAFVTLVASLLTAWILGRGASRLTRVGLVTTGWVVALLAGGARVIMGAHWPSDVLAGLALGTVWVSVVTAIAESRGGGRQQPAGAPQVEVVRR